MTALSLALAFALAGPAAPGGCADMTPTSTFADQFLCYKNAGRKVLVPGTAFVVGFDGPGCITAVGADRIQVSSCGPGTIGRKSVTIPLASIHAVADDDSERYVTIVLVSQTVQVDCRYEACGEVVYVPAPPPPAAPAERRIAAPRKP